jgi:hypothetical protein
MPTASLRSLLLICIFRAAFVRLLVVSQATAEVHVGDAARKAGRCNPSLRDETLSEALVAGLLSISDGGPQVERRPNRLKKGAAGLTSSNVWPPSSAHGKDARDQTSARAHRPAWIAVYIPVPFQYGLGLDRAEPK